MMKPYKHSDEKSAVKHPSSYQRVPGRDSHSASEKQVQTVREGAKSGHKDSKRDR